MKKSYQRKPLPGHRRGMEVRDSAVEAAEAAQAENVVKNKETAQKAETAKAAKTTATANPAKTGGALPPNQPPDDNAPVTRGEFREEVHKLDKRIEVGFAETDKKMEVGFAEADKKMDVGFAETDKKIGATKAELKDDIHKLDKKMDVGFAETKAELKDEIQKSGRTTLWAVMSTFASLVVAVMVAMFGMLYYVLNTVST